MSERSGFYESLPEINRMKAVDHMRGFIFLLMAVDHALHAYAANWGKFAFFRDYDRSYIFDALYLFNQAAIMPVLFFTFGVYVLPKLSAYGFKAFWKDRFVKYMIPYIVGVPLVVPLLSFPRYAEFNDPGMSYMYYWQNVFFPDKLQAGPYWVMYALVLYTLIFLVINQFFPKLVNSLAHWLQSAFKRPVVSVLAFAGLSILVYGISDLRYGAPWWVGLRDLLPDFMYGQLFSLQGSKYAMNFVYFFMGAVFMRSQVWQAIEIQDYWLGFIGKRYFWLLCTLTFGFFYVFYAHAFFHDGAYDYTLFKTIRLGNGTWEAYKEAFALLPETAPLVLIRTSLLGVVAMLQVITLVAFFGALNHRVERGISGKAAAFWSSAAACCWGIFILHDPIMIWLQYYLTTIDFHIFVKFLIVTFGGIVPAWIVTIGLLKIPYIKRVFELD